MSRPVSHMSKRTPYVEIALTVAVMAFLAIVIAGGFSPRNDETALREAVTDDFVNHEAPPDVPPGPDSVIFFMHLLDRAFSDQRWDIDKAAWK